MIGYCTASWCQPIGMYDVCGCVVMCAMWDNYGISWETSAAQNKHRLALHLIGEGTCSDWDHRHVAISGKSICFIFDGTMWPHYIIMRPQFGVREKTNHRKILFPKFPYQMDMVFLQVVKNYTGRCRYNVVNTTWYCAMADAECKSIFFSQNRHAKSHANGWFTECLMWGFGRKQTL